MDLLKKLALVSSGAFALATPVVADGFDLSEKLSISGFIDMSYRDLSSDTANSDESVAGLDQFEIDFMYDFGNDFKARVDLEYQDDNGDGTMETQIEEAYFTLPLSDSVTFKAGKFLSYSGWETEEPTGLFQYSGAGYGGYFYGGYQQGVSVNYSSEMFGLGASVVDDIGGSGSAGVAEDPGIELMFALYPSEAFTFKAFYLTDTVVDAAGDYTTSKFNFWASYATGGFTFAAEYNMADDLNIGEGSEGTGYLLMGNYAWDNGFGLTLRYHGWDVETAAGVSADESTGFTFAPSYAVNDNLLLVAEYRTESVDAGGDRPATQSDYDQIALEALITF